MRALVIADLGFGDSGKGFLTDFLVRQTRASVVVRFNGGAQAGHNVVTADGRHHTFSQFGSGTFVPGVRTFLSRDVVVHPTALLREESSLRAAGVGDALDRLRISAEARVITPYHQSLGRLREIARGTARHGSCGVGVGETVAHDRERPGETLRMADTANRACLRRKLRRVREYAWEEVRRLDFSAVGEEESRAELAIFHRPDALEEWIVQAHSLAALAGDETAWLPRSNESSTVVFEGAQGILLDERHGFHPYTTWSTCTTAPATRLLSDLAPGADVCRIGVLRTYAVRHGPGPLPTETSELTNTPPEHNSFNVWQGGVRRGWFDGVCARYAVSADGGIDTLAVTHLDWLPRIARWTYCDGYRPDIRLRPSATHSLEQQETLTAQLASARPVLQELPAIEEDVIGAIERIVGKPVLIGSRGPTAVHGFIRPHKRETG